MRTRFSTARNSIAAIAAIIAGAAFLAAATPAFAGESLAPAWLAPFLADCEAKRRSGEVKGLLGAAICSEPAMRDAMLFNLGYPDLIDLFLAKRRVIAEQADKGLLTKAELFEKFAELRAEITEKDRARRVEEDSARAARSGQAESTRLQEQMLRAQQEAADAQEQQELMQLDRDMEHILSPEPYR